MLKKELDVQFIMFRDCKYKYLFVEGAYCGKE